MPIAGDFFVAQVRMFGSETGDLHSLIDPEVLPEDQFGGLHPDNGGWEGGQRTVG